MESEKTFDAVAMVRKIRDDNYELTKGMSSEERLRYTRDRGRKARAEFEQLAKELAAKQERKP